MLKNLQTKDRALFLLFAIFSAVWLILAVGAILFRQADHAVIQSLAVPLVIFGTISQPQAFNDPRAFFLQAWPVVTKACYALAAISLAFPMWAFLFK